MEIVRLSVSIARVLPCLVFEDEHLLVVNKPAGWNTHAPDPYAGEGIYDWLRHREPRWAGLAIIHRLDKETSGLLIFSKTTLASRSLTRQFTHRTVRKKYWLLTDRTVPQAEVVVKTALIRAGEKYLARPLHAGAVSAETRFRVISGPQASSVINRWRQNLGITQSSERQMEAHHWKLLEAEPKTGRTHQIRVHAATSGFPILGDTLYGGSDAARLFLHAAELSLVHPATGEPICFCSNSDPNPSLRRALVEPDQTNSYRVIHGAADGFPGWYVDRLGDYLLAQSESALSLSQQRALRSLLEQSGARAAYFKRLRQQPGDLSRDGGCPELVFGEPAPQKFIVRENGLQFELSFNEGYSIGLFLDQRDNRRRLLNGHIASGFPLFLNEARAEPRALNVLNAFAYTCGFSVCAARFGARTTSLDLSRKYLEWGQRNFVRNGLDPVGHDFIYGDVFDWMRRLAKKQRSFSLVLLDPPTFSQSKQSGPFRVQKDYGRLLEAALPLLQPGGVLFTSANAAEWPAPEFVERIEKSTQREGRRICQSHYFPQPPDFPIARTEPAYLKTAWFRIE